jgi:hypothetical protein
MHIKLFAIALAASAATILSRSSASAANPQVPIPQTAAEVPGPPPGTAMTTAYESF